jgi:hypothetical protein
MARQTVNIGSAPNDGTGDPLRVAYDKLNDNFLEIYDEGGANIIVNNPVTLTETTLDVALADIEAGSGGGSVTSVNSDTGSVIVDLQSATDEGNETTNDVIFRLDADKFIKVDSTNQVIQIFDLTIDAVNPIAYWNGTQISFADASNNVLDMSPTYFASNFADGSLWQFSGAILNIGDGSGSMDLTPNALQFNAGASATLYSIDKITIDGVDYDLPTGASSQIATLLDIPSPITIDATPTDGSSNAVSSNGVFDALALRKKVIVSDTVSASVTGVIVETLVKTYEVPVGSLSTSGFLDLFAYSSRAVSAAVHTMTIKINSTNNFATASTIATVNTNGNFAPFLAMKCAFVLKDNLIIGNVVNSSTGTNYVNSGSQYSITCNNTSNSVWFFVSITPTNTGQIVTLQGVEILN